MTHACLNCNQPTESNFCSNCGQKTSTHRFSIKHFFVHDLVHGILHLDKGLPYTIKELFTRPGDSIREFVQGKRTKHFNYFATALFILVLDYLISKSFSIDVSKWLPQSAGYIKGLKDFFKIVPFIGIPFYALASYLLFIKSKQNYTEHMVLNIYMICGWLFISVLFKITLIFIHDASVFFTLNWIAAVLIAAYIAVFYYQYFSVFNYNKVSLVVRVVLIALLITIIKQLINDGLNELALRYLH